MRETLQHRDAFEAYYKMGTNRSCTKVATKVGVKPETVEKWSKELQWQQRVEDRDKEIADRVAKKNIEEDIDTRLILNKAINKSVHIYITMVDGKTSIDLDTVKILDSLVNSHIKLTPVEVKAESVGTKAEAVNNETSDTMNQIDASLQALKGGAN